MDSTADSLFENIWQTYQSRLLDFIQKRVEDRMTSEDILQEVFLRIYSNLPSLRDATRLQGWIYQITRNAIVDYYRLKHTSQPLPEWLAAADVEVEENIEKELSCCLLPMIEELPEKYREAILLSDIEGIAQRKIAQSQQISLSAVKSRVQRGRQMLKKMFEDCCRFVYDVRGELMFYEPKCNDCGEKA
ncbi:MAG: RNA polymerase sigma factor SigZ [Chloroflexota bacterium]|nr:MAG: RNA polymerase sigma factor SigZ [Bellilinea sp.]